VRIRDLWGLFALSILFGGLNLLVPALHLVGVSAFWMWRILGQCRLTGSLDLQRQTLWPFSTFYATFWAGFFSELTQPVFGELIVFTTPCFPWFSGLRRYVQMSNSRGPGPWGFLISQAIYGLFWTLREQFVWRVAHESALFIFPTCYWNFLPGHADSWYCELWNW